MSLPSRNDLLFRVQTEMTLLRAFSRGSSALTAVLFALQNLQKTTLSYQLHSSDYESPRKFVTNDDASLLHHSSLNFNEFQFGIFSSASLNPLGKENGQLPTESSLDTSLGEATVTYQPKISDIFEATAKFMMEIIEFTEAEKKGIKRLKNKDRALSEIAKSKGSVDVVKIKEIKELINTKQKLIEELVDKVQVPLQNVVAGIECEMKKSKKLGILGFLTGIGRASTHGKGSYSEIDESKYIAASLHEQLEFARGYFYYLKPMFEEIREDMELKVDDLIRVASELKFD